MLVSADKSYSHQTLSCIKYTTIEQYWYYNCTLYQDNPKIVITPIFFFWFMVSAADFSWCRMGVNL